jgi:uncharacterized cupin superfamily protein
MMTSTVLATAAEATLELEPMPASWVINGNPVTRSKRVAKSRDFTEYVMVWDCTPGRFTWHYNKDETLVVVSGETYIRSDNGVERRLGPGDWAFFPAGCKAEWHVTKHLRKVAVLKETLPRPLGFAVRLCKGALRKVGIGGHSPLLWVPPILTTILPDILDALS